MPDRSAEDAARKPWVGVYDSAMAARGLTQAQIDAYRDDGVVVVPQILGEAEQAALISEIDDWVDARARVLIEEGHLALAGAFEDEPFETRYARLFEKSPLIGAGLDIAFMRGPGLFRFLTAEPLLDAVESLIGKEIVLNPIHHLRAKPPQPLVPDAVETYFNVPWHQDSGVMWEEADAVPVVGVWIPLVDATHENGCMQVMPGVAQRGHLPHQAEGGTMIVPEQLPEVPPRMLECPRGGAVFQNKFTPHRSTPNRTGGVRWSLDVRFQPAGLPTGRPFHPAFLVRSEREPEKVVRDPAVWAAKWKKTLRELQEKPAPVAHRIAQ